MFDNEEYVKQLFSGADKLEDVSEIPPNMIYPIAFSSMGRAFKTSFLERLMSTDRRGRRELFNMIYDDELHQMEKSDNENMNRIL